MNRETVYLLYNIIWVTFVYKPLDFFFPIIFLQNDRNRCQIAYIEN